MANVEGQVIHDGKVVGYFEYYGSSSIAPTAFFDTWDEVWQHWRTMPEATCTCGKAVSVMLYTEYGGGSYWPSEACLTCHAITGIRCGYDEPLDINEWPKDGHPLGDEHQTEWARLCNG